MSAVEEVKLVSFHTGLYAREVVVGRKTPVYAHAFSVHNPGRKHDPDSPHQLV